MKEEDIEFLKQQLNILIKVHSRRLDNERDSIRAYSEGAIDTCKMILMIVECGKEKYFDNLCSEVSNNGN